MSEHIDSVNEVARIYRKSGKTIGGARGERHSRQAERLEAVSAELVRLYGLTSALSPDLGNIHDLPPELQNELSVTKADALEDQLVTVINAYGGQASLDQILVGLYRKFEISQKRRFLQNKLYRMSMIWSVPGRKGIYTTKEPEPHPLGDSNTEIVLGEEVENILEDTSESIEEEDREEIPF